MTQHRRPGTSADTVSTAVTALMLSAGAGIWTSWLEPHSRSFATPPPWPVTAVLLLPPLLLALLLARPLLRSCLQGVAGGGTLDELVYASTAAVLAAFLVPLVLGLRAGLLGGEHGGPLAVQVPMLLPATLLAALVAPVLTGAGPELAAAAGRLAALGRRPRSVRRVLVPVVCGSLLAALGGLLPAGTASAASDSGPCPASLPGQSRSYDVQAINVDIPINRFGDHDPRGRMYVLSSKVAAVRAEERTQQVSIGQRDDPIQPLIIRADQGDCVTITYTNNADGGDFGLHIDGLAFASSSSGDAVGNNAGSNPATGQTRTYTYYVPVDATLEGAHYLHPGPGFRNAVGHGLFGSLVVEPPGSTYLDPNADDESHAAVLTSGWEAIVRPAGYPEFRENVQLYHEIGNENEKDAVLQKDGHPVPFVDPHTDAYRPDTRAINYRSEGFWDRLNFAPDQEAHAYGSYTFGDPATLIPRGYRGDPTKFRILHAGSEMFHVFHMHGGGIRRRFNPTADPTHDYSRTGLDKHPAEISDSERLDSQSFGPGESYNLEIEGGAGGVQQGAGDFLFHCHIAEHYVAGMWSFWRVYDTLQPGFAPLADRQDNAAHSGYATPKPVTSKDLIGKTYAGQTITAANLDDWILPQLPPQGLRHNSQDAGVWDWATDPADASTYLGEPEQVNPSYPDNYNAVSGHPMALPGDTFVGDRPVLLFNPDNGRPAYPLMRPHLGMRPPFSPNGHSGAPYLGELSHQAPANAGTVDPYANRKDSICPSTEADGSTATKLRRFNVVAIEHAVKVTPKDTDPTGMVYSLAHDKAAFLDGSKPLEPLALRANVGECVAVTLTSEMTDTNAANHFSQVNIHIHHVQFDTQASDGVITGMQYEQAVRPYKLEDPQLTATTPAGGTVLTLSSVAKFHVGQAVGVGLGTEGRRPPGPRTRPCPAPARRSGRSPRSTPRPGP